MSNAIIGALRVSLGLDSAAFTNGLGQAQARLKAAGAQMQKIGAAATAAGTGIALAIKSQLNAADEMSKAAQKFGVPIEALSQLAYAGDLSDVALDQLGTALGVLSKNMVKFDEGSASAIAAFDGVGVSATDAAGNLRPTQDVLAALADAFAGMEDGPAKTAAAMALMGKSGKDMVPLLNGGGDALRQMMAEADALGLTLTEETGKAAEQFNDNLTRLQKTFGGIATQVTAEFAPVLATISDVLVDLAGVFQGLSPDARAFAAAFTAIAVAIGPLLVAGGGLLLLASVVGAPAIGIAAVVAAAGAACVVWADDLRALGQAVAGAKDAVIAFGTDALDWIKAKPAEIAAAFSDLPAQMRAVGSDVIGGLLSGMSERWESLKATVYGWADALPQWMRDRLGIQSPSTVFAEIGRNVMAGLSRGLDSEMEGVGAGMQDFARDIAGTLEGVLTGATSFREGLAGILGNAGSSFISKGVSGLGAAFGIPGFAAGTNFAPGGLAMVGERGPELVSLPRGARVTPNHRLGGAQAVDVRVHVDRDGNWQAAVERISVARVRAEAPRIVGQSVRTVQEGNAASRRFMGG